MKPKIELKDKKVIMREVIRTSIITTKATSTTPTIMTEEVELDMGKHISTFIKNFRK